MPTFNRRAVVHLKRVDPRLATVVAQAGPCRFALRTEGTHFEAVARAIVYQQLSGKAAATIYGRFTALFQDDTPLAGSLLELSDVALQSAGLSRQKSGYLRDLAAKVDSGQIAIDALHELDDPGVMETLTSIKGVGPWTAQMFLMFRLRRPDILPELDLGIQKGIQRAYRLRALPSPDRVRQIGTKWAPYRTIAAWYLWRSLDGER